jgi:hypothetical protein
VNKVERLSLWRCTDPIEHYCHQMMLEGGAIFEIAMDISIMKVMNIPTNIMTNAVNAVTIVNYVRLVRPREFLLSFIIVYLDRHAAVSLPLATLPTGDLSPKGIAALSLLDGSLNAIGPKLANRHFFCEHPPRRIQFFFSHFHRPQF